MTNLELAHYYANLLILQYRGKDKAYATILDLIEDITILEILTSIENGYDIETAVGVQQDVLGKWIGVNRTITGGVFDRDYFGYITYADTPPVTGILGYAQYGVLPPDAQFRSYEDSNTSLYDLTDTEFRTIQKLKIIQNNSNYSPTEIDDLLTELFGNDIIFNDRQDMTISYIFNENVQRLVQIAQSQDLLPRPMAVGVSVSFTPDTEAIFGYGSYGNDPASFIVGYSEYGDYDPVGGWASYG